MHGHSFSTSSGPSISSPLPRSVASSAWHFHGTTTSYRLGTSNAKRWKRLTFADLGKPWMRLLMRSIRRQRPVAGRKGVGLFQQPLNKLHAGTRLDRHACAMNRLNHHNYIHHHHNHHRLTAFFRVAPMDESSVQPTAEVASRRGERRLRMHWRHEQLSLRMALAAATHHSAQAGDAAGSVGGGLAAGATTVGSGGRSGVRVASAAPLRCVLGRTADDSTAEIGAELVGRGAFFASFQALSCLRQRVGGERNRRYHVAEAQSLWQSSLSVA